MAKLNIERRTLPTWVVVLFCITSMLLLVASIMELPGHFSGPWYSAVFGVFKVALWGIMTFVYVPDAIKRLKAKS